MAPPSGVYCLGYTKRCELVLASVRRRDAYVCVSGLSCCWCRQYNDDDLKKKCDELIKKACNGEGKLI